MPVRRYRADPTTGEPDPRFFQTIRGLMNITGPRASGGFWGTAAEGRKEGCKATPAMCCPARVPTKPMLHWRSMAPQPGITAATNCQRRGGMEQLHALLPSECGCSVLKNPCHTLALLCPHQVMRGCAWLQAPLANLASLGRHCSCPTRTIAWPMRSCRRGWWACTVTRSSMTSSWMWVSVQRACSLVAPPLAAPSSSSSLLLAPCRQSLPMRKGFVLLLGASLGAAM